MKNLLIILLTVAAVWKPVLIDTTGINVQWSEKYGPVESVCCIGLWETDIVYRLTYKNAKFIELQKANVNKIFVDRTIQCLK